MPDASVTPLAPLRGESVTQVSGMKPLPVRRN